MTTITFEKDLKIRKRKFKDIADFRNYIDENTQSVELEILPKSEISLSLVNKMKETKKINKAGFVNI